MEAGLWKETDDEAITVHGRTDHWGAAGARHWGEDGGFLPQARISSATFFKWKSKYGGIDVSDARRLKVLEEENRKLKKLLAETMLDIAMLKEVN